MTEEEDPKTLLRQSKLIAIAGGLLLAVGGIIFITTGEGTASMQSPLPFVGLMGIVLGVLFLIVSRLGYAKALSTDTMHRNAGQSDVLSKNSLRNLKIIVGGTTLLLTLWLVVAPLVLRILFGVPIGHQTLTEIQAKQNDPNFAGCFQKEFSPRSVTCKGTGYDGLLEFFMHMPGRSFGQF